MKTQLEEAMTPYAARAIVVLPLPVSVAEFFPDYGNRSHPHMTMAYLPGPFTKLQIDGIAAEVEAWVNEVYDPVKCADAEIADNYISLAYGFMTFQSDVDDTLILAKKPQDWEGYLTRQHQALVRRLRDAGFHPQTRDEFLPHVTVKYGVEATDPRCSVSESSRRDPGRYLTYGRTVDHIDFKILHVEVWTGSKNPKICIALPG